MSTAIDNTHETRPRQYAGEILQLHIPEARREALALVPNHLRDWVEEYVRDAFAKRCQMKEA